MASERASERAYLREAVDVAVVEQPRERRAQPEGQTSVDGPAHEHLVGKLPLDLVDAVVAAPEHELRQHLELLSIDHVVSCFATSARWGVRE